MTTTTLASTFFSATSGDDHIRLRPDPNDAFRMIIESENRTFETINLVHQSLGVTIRGEAGDDIIAVESLGLFGGTVELAGGDGTDLLVASSASAVTLNNETLTLGADQFTIGSIALPNTFEAASLDGPTVDASGFDGAVLSGVPQWESEGPGVVDVSRIRNLTTRARLKPSSSIRTTPTRFSSAPSAAASGRPRTSTPPIRIGYR